MLCFIGFRDYKRMRGGENIVEAVCLRTPGTLSSSSSIFIRSLFAKDDGDKI